MFYFKTNLRIWERVMRVVMGAALAALAFSYGTAPWVGWAGTAAGLGLAATGFVGFCPMCAMVGRRPIERAE